MARRIFLAFGGYGDVAVTWDEQNDDQVLPVIQDMLEKGVKFFILAQRMSGEGRDQGMTLDDVKVGRHIILPNDGLEQLRLSGLVAAGKVEVSGDSHVGNTGEIAKTAQEVVENDTVATPPASGG